MSISLGQANDKRLNHGAKFEDFPVGSRVKVVCLCQDMYFFNPDTQNTNGTVIENKGSYLGIIVKWDEPRHYEGDYIQYEFNFNPTDLVLLEEKQSILENSSEEFANFYKEQNKLLKKLINEINNQLAPYEKTEGVKYIRSEIKRALKELNE